MKITSVLLLSICLHASATVWSQNVTLKARNMPLSEAFAKLESQSGYFFIWSNEVLSNAGTINADIVNVPLSSALKMILADHSLTYSYEGKLIVIKRVITPEIPSSVTAMYFPIRGTVYGADAVGLSGVNVVVKGTAKGTVTDASGKFELNVVQGNTLVISSIGYKTKEIKISSPADIAISLEADVKDIDSVTVVSTGYQTIPKERATGSFGVVSASDMRGKLQTNIVDRLEGMVAGLTSYKGNIQIRGVSTLAGQSDPLYVVDGIPFEGSLAALNPNDIASVTVLKDATAASIYGARSANGVIVIVTRGGVKGPMQIAINSTVKLSPLPDRNYQNRMSSRELVDFQYDMFKLISVDYASIDPRKSMNDVSRLLYERKAGNITEEKLQEELEVYRNNDRYDQVVDELLRKNSVIHQHNIAFSGGTDFHKYNLSANFMETNPYEKAQNTKRTGFNLKNNFNFTKWLKADVGLLGSNISSKYNNGFLGYSNLNDGEASYFMLRNSDGTPAQWYKTKSQKEIDRLNSVGLQDETYRPLDELEHSQLTNNSKYLNINIGASIRIISGLTLDFRYQKERTEDYRKQLYDKDSYTAKTLINDGTKRTPNAPDTNFIPLGGQLNETRSDQNSHTVRAQLNYNKSLFNGKHQIQAIAGGEQRKVVTSGTNIIKYGYDDFSLNYKTIDENRLRKDMFGTESILDGGKFRLDRAETGFAYTENRYVAFFGNASYTYNRKITASGSIRMDQSNLFGTDPKYQYKPLWSAGLLYVITENQLDWLDRLAVRTTYGINGNIAKLSGPYLISQDETATNYYTNETQASIVSPPNSGLRWEKTYVTNLGLDFSLFNRRLSGSIEYYNKATNDLFASQLSDPTIGWSSVTVNYGSMFNRGVDVSLTSQNIRSKNVSWNTTLNFNYNKNQLTDLENSSNTVSTYIYSAQNRVGKPMGAIYSVRYAGLNNLGRPKAYTLDGKEVSSLSNLTVDDLIYQGTDTPPYSASLQNTVNYKGFELYCMFIYYGGHVMRDVRSVYLSRGPQLNGNGNPDRNLLNYWKKAGDELDPNVTPAFFDGAATTTTFLWDAADSGVEKADYIKLRDVTLSYNLPAGLLNRYSIRGMRLSLNMQNAWRWSSNKQNLDPEVWSGSSLSTSRGSLIPPTYTVGLSLNF